MIAVEDAPIISEAASELEIRYHQWKQARESAQEFDPTNFKTAIEKPKRRPTTPQAVINKAVAGDTEAFAKLYEVYDRPVERFVRAALIRAKQRPKDDEMQDLCHEVWAAALQSIRSFQGRCSLSTWLAAITKRKVSDFVREKIRRESVCLTIDSDDKSPKLNHAAMIEWLSRRSSVSVNFKIDVDRAISQLPERQRMTLVFRLLGAKFGEIASAMTVTVNGATKTCSDAIANLRKAYGVAEVTA